MRFFSSYHIYALMLLQCHQYWHVALGYIFVYSCLVACGICVECSFLQYRALLHSPWPTPPNFVYDMHRKLNPNELLKRKARQPAAIENFKRLHLDPSQSPNHAPFTSTTRQNVTTTIVVLDPESCAKEPNVNDPPNLSMNEADPIENNPAKPTKVRILRVMFLPLRMC